MTCVALVVDSADAPGDIAALGFQAKRKNIGRDPYEVSLDTVRGFAKDIAALGFHILP